MTEIEKIEKLLYPVTDPEIPVLSIMDMGIVRSVEADGKDVLVKITPTYSGCPAMDVIGMEIKMTLDKAGYNTTVKQEITEAWTTDWITPEGRKKLEAYGVAAPLGETADKLALMGEKRQVKCTNCGSFETKMVSQFGSTACKALFQCEDCLEPFDYFKCLK